jgi:hypothetical protein
LSQQKATQESTLIEIALIKSSFSTYVKLWFGNLIFTLRYLAFLQGSSSCDFRGDGSQETPPPFSSIEEVKRLFNEGAGRNPGLIWV